MLKIYDAEAARQTLLRRAPLGAEPYPPALLERVERAFGKGATPAQAVARILASVRDEGDAALRRWSETLDGVRPDDFRIPADQLASAFHALPTPLANAMRTAAERIRAFHERQPLRSWTTRALGGTLGQKVTAIHRVGLYVPGGSAPLPSSLLMAAIPAHVAGVEEIVVCTPPTPHPTILAAAHLCEVTRVFQIGGAQAIAAMALGTDSVSKVDKIVGAGNIFVTLAKQQVFGLVGLDGLAGPTETVVIADEAANPAWVAADLLAQAEHDPLASAILITPSRELAEAVQAEVARRIESLSRAEIIVQSLSQRGGIVLTSDLAEAADLADEYGPEHLCLSVAGPETLAARIRNAGGLFIGEGSFEVLGDYVAGPSHIMPTGGTARFASPLNVLDFVKITSLIALDPATSAALSPLAAELARAESLTAHASAAEARIPQSESVTPHASRFTSPPIRSHVDGLEPYQPIAPFEVLSRQLGRAPEAIVKLDANENPYGPLPTVAEALARLPFAHVYPDPASTALRQALSSHTGLPMENLLAGAGADELIDLVMRLFVEPGDAILNCPPTFGMYAFDAGVNAARLVIVPRAREFSIDLDALERAVREFRPKLLFLASPNNPDGSLLPDDALDRLLALPLVVVLDEAYIEFASTGASRISLVPTRENLIVLRTFSKWAGLAGLRLGYGAFPAGLMPPLWKIKQPYNVSVAASAAGIASLKGASVLNARARKLIAERHRLLAALKAIPYLRPYPSQANFVLCRVVGRDAAALKAALASAGILVRYFDKPGLTDCIRISVGKPEHTDALIEALKDL